MRVRFYKTDSFGLVAQLNAENQCDRDNLENWYQQAPDGLQIGSLGQKWNIAEGSPGMDEIILGWRPSTPPRVPVWWVGVVIGISLVLAVVCAIGISTTKQNAQLRSDLAACSHVR